MTSRRTVQALLAFICCFGCPGFGRQIQEGKAQSWALAVHGGAGSSEWEHMDAATAAAYRTSLERALNAGVEKLKHGGRALDAVEAAINVLEDDPLFNAGRGAAFDAEGKNEMDASLMDGATLRAGSVAGIRF